MPPSKLLSLERLMWLQGVETDLTKELRLMLLIQPNCPGCHIHAIPTANSFEHERVDVYCVSTAFEDFEFNTIESTRLLLQGTHVGEARARLGESSVASIPNVPVAHDIMVQKKDASEELKQITIEAIKDNARKQFDPHFAIVLESQLETVGEEILPELIAECFYRVAAMGTPTWVLHDRHGRVLASVIGPHEEAELRTWIDGVLLSMEDVCNK